MIRIINADFYTWSMSNLDDDSIDCIITDPPYPKEFLPLWSKLSEMALAKLKPSGMVIAYSGQYHLSEVMIRMSEYLDYLWLGCLLHQGTTGVVWQKRFIAGWKPILFYQKPPFKGLDKSTIDRFVEPVVSGGRDKTKHKWGQSDSGVYRIMKYFTKPGDLILEPFAGGGTTLVVAKQLERNCIGIEIDKKYIDIINSRLDVKELF